jgi:hypothetical protein
MRHWTMRVPDGEVALTSTRNGTIRLQADGPLDLQPDRARALRQALGRALDHAEDHQPPALGRRPLADSLDFLADQLAANPRRGATVAGVIITLRVLADENRPPA